MSWNIEFFFWDWPRSHSSILLWIICSWRHRIHGTCVQEGIIIRSVNELSSLYSKKIYWSHNFINNVSRESIRFWQNLNTRPWLVEAQIIGAIPPIYLNWIFFPVWNQLVIFASFMARVKYFDGPCLTINSLSTIYRDIHYQFPVWWIQYSHCYESIR